MAMKNRRFRDRARCRFCREKVKKMDYKDLQSLQKLTTGQGKLFSRKRSEPSSDMTASGRPSLFRSSTDVWYGAFV